MAEPGNKSDMAETKDSAIKLFGMTISLQTEQAEEEEEEEEEEEGSSSIHAKLDVTEKEEKSGLGFDDVKGPPVSKVENQHDDMKEEEDEEEEREEKFAKPDKILPCPRCNSFETKFCYFNNYNVNQPRHFCRNCQRYWTAGGTMRNVPIGAGRRRNKLLRIHDSTLIRSANSETTHLTPIVNFSHREAKEEDHTHTTNHVVPVPVAPFVYQCNRILDTSNNPNRIQTNGIIPFQFVPMPCWVWTLGGGNRNMQQPVVGFDNMGLDKNGSSRLGKHSRDDFYEEKQHSMLGFKTPRRADEP